MLDITVLAHIQRNPNGVFYEAYKYGIHAERNAIMSVKNKNLLASSKIVIVRLKDGKVVRLSKLGLVKCVKIYCPNIK